MARSTIRSLVLTFSALLIMFGLNVVAAAPATAIPGLNNVPVASAFNSNVFKAVTANCPAGQVVIGGGARLSLATGEVSITRMSPTAANDGYEAWAYEDFDGFAGNWAIQVIAICAPPPPGYVVVPATSPTGSPPTATVTAACPAGLRVLGTGGWVFPGRGVVMLTGIVPSPIAAPTSVTVLGTEVAGGFTGGWNLQAWAICAAPVAGHTIAVTTGPFDSTSPKSQTAGCPAGTFVHGVGFQFGGGTGEIMLNAAFPNPPMPTGTTVPALASEDQSGFFGNWALRTFASCAP